MGALPSSVVDLVRGGIVSVAGMCTMNNDAVALGKTIALGRPTTAAPAHTPVIPSQQEVAQVKRELDQARKELVQWKHEWPGVISSLAKCKADIDSREKACKERLARYEALEEEAREYPCPEYLQQAGYEGTVNVAVVGGGGVGKSLFINTLRGVGRGEDTWAPVGVTEETAEPARYMMPGDERTRLWDFPGAGSESCPRDEYVRRVGMRYYDAVLLLSATRFTETEILLLKELRKHGVPHFLVRTKTDIDIENNRVDCGVSPEDTKQRIINELRENAVADPYLINSRELAEHDFPRLVEDVLQVVARNRLLGEAKAEEPAP